jgi:signal transduction histidine kinase
MKFNGPLNKSAQARVDQSNEFLKDPARLEALRKTGLMNSPSEIAFDRLAHLAARILKVPLTIVSFVGESKQFFKAGHGLPSPYDVSREVPIDTSICRYTLAGEAIIAEDATQDALLKFHPTIGPWGVGAFIAIPMVDPEGNVLGAFCAVDSQKRPWSAEDISTMEELTASVMTEINLRSQIAELNIERELRETFVTALTHDLRNPLAASKMSAQILARKSPESEQIQRVTSRISENIDRADRMIQNLLDANQIKSGHQVPLSFTKCDLSEVAKKTVEDLRMLHGEMFLLETDLDLVGHWDGTAIRRIIENLGTNAIKYGDPEKPIRISLLRINNSIQLSVHNQGNPIPAHEQQSIFELFHRSSSASEGVQKGWGIGLTLVRGLAIAHGGRAEVSSSQEEGTTFTVILPIH